MAKVENNSWIVWSSMNFSIDVWVNDGIEKNKVGLGCKIRRERKLLFACFIEWTWRLLWHFLQVLKNKSEFRRKKENSMNKTLCVRLTIIHIIRRNFYFTFFKKMKNLKYLVFFPNNFSTLKKKSSSKQEMAALILQRLVCLFQNVYFPKCLFYCAYNPLLHWTWQ